MTRLPPLAPHPAALVLCAVLLAAAACRANRITTAAQQPAPRPVPNADAFLDDVSQRTFRWFWETTNPQNGLTPDRWPTKSFSSVAAVGFALAAYGIGAERGYVSRAQAAERA